MQQGLCSLSDHLADHLVTYARVAVYALSLNSSITTGISRAVAAW